LCHRRVVAAVSRELEINDATLGCWITAYKSPYETGQIEVTETERAKLRRLRKKLGLRLALS